MEVRRIILVQPPFVQLNGPYPAPYYLKAFLEKRGQSVTVLDHSIGLFERIFSRAGLEQIFSDASIVSVRDRANIDIIERFLSGKDLWLNSIDRLTAFLRGRDHEWGHFLALSNGCLPGGPRTDAYLAERDGNLKADEVTIFATKLLSDLADFITCTLDSGFSLVRYAPVMEASLKAGFRDFATVQKSLDGYIMNNFYRPLLAEEWKKLESNGEIGTSQGAANSPFLLGLTIPFPGCLSGALVCAESAKKRFGAAVRTAAGGGFVNTELRFCNNPDFFEYFDYVSFDRGYGSMVSILEHIKAGEKNNEPVYKTKYRSPGAVISSDGIASSTADHDTALSEDLAIRTNFPDYSGVDFNRYLYPVDDANPMHRLWSDGHWLKAYLAHGCYWHSCTFCDVTLDYIKNFVPVDVPALFNHLLNQAEQTGIRGIHFCDEAAPVSVLLEFALLNREAGLPFCFWGNIRFEKNFSPDVAAILAAGGLIGVSAGIEVATESGFKRLGKGINLESVVGACAAFKEAGILTHAYLIYGYWDEEEEEIIDSAETLRQFFFHGLLDSAFWHKFVLTRHSRIYAEKQRGLHSGLIIKDDPASERGVLFALNDLSFEGEEKYDIYTEGLDRLLAAWMAGDIDTPVDVAFPFVVHKTSVPPDLVLNLLDNYAGNRDAERQDAAGQNVTVLFLGSVPLLRQEGKDVFLRWYWRLAGCTLKTHSRAEAEKIITLLETASGKKGMNAVELFLSLEDISGKIDAVRIWKYLRKSGLAAYRNT